MARSLDKRVSVSLLKRMEVFWVILKLLIDIVRTGGTHHLERVCKIDGYILPMGNFHHCAHLQVTVMTQSYSLYLTGLHQVREIYKVC